MQIFISHSSGDKPFIRLLSAELMRIGVKRVWLDEVELKPGEILSEKFSSAIATSDYLLVCLSKKSISSKWVQYEITQACTLNKDKRGPLIIPLTIDDISTSASSNLINDILHIDISSPKIYNKGLEKLINSINLPADAIEDISLNGERCISMIDILQKWSRRMVGA